MVVPKHYFPAATGGMGRLCRPVPDHCLAWSSGDLAPAGEGAQRRQKLPEGAGRRTVGITRVRVAAATAQNAASMAQPELHGIGALVWPIGGMAIGATPAGAGAVKARISAANCAKPSWSRVLVFISDSLLLVRLFQKLAATVAHFLSRRFKSLARGCKPFAELILAGFHATACLFRIQSKLADQVRDGWLPGGLNAEA